MDNALISLHDATIQAGGSAVLFSVNLELYEGDFAYIIGKVGTGKTSIFRTLIAESPLREGDGTVCGFSLNKIKRRQIPYLRRSLGVVFQDFQLLMDRSVTENLEFALRATGWKKDTEISRRISEVLSAVSLKEKAHKMPHQLSGGEQQRVAIARAILNNPKVILADEPTGNLDAETADSVMEVLSDINSSTGTAILMITHNRQLCDKYPGKIFECRDESLKLLGNDAQAEVR